MPLFVRNHSIALTWTSQNCQAVRLAVSGSKCKVQAAWRGAIGENGASLAEILAHAWKAVGGDDSTYVIAGPRDTGWGMAAADAPANLRGEELRNALAFELRKHTPLPPERLRWGFRRLPRAKGDAQQPVRLVFATTDHWNAWMKAIDGLHHVDALLPAPAALDPLFADTTVILPVPGSVYAFEPGEGGRVLAPRPESAPPSLAEALPGLDLDAEAIDALPEEQRREFPAAVVLALYGLTASVSADRDTLFQLPEHFAAHRNIAVKFIAAAAAIYLLGLVVYWLAASFQATSAQIRLVDAEIVRTRNALNAINKLMSPKDAERIRLLRQELLDNTPDRPDFPVALLAITKTIPKDAWIAQSLDWRDGKISFQIQTPVKNLSLAQQLEESPWLGDVSEKVSSYNQNANVYTQRFELTARYDTPQEAEALRIQQARRREQQRRDALQKKSEDAAEAPNGDSDGKEGEGDARPAAPADKPAAPEAKPAAPAETATESTDD